MHTSAPRHLTGLTLLWIALVSAVAYAQEGQGQPAATTNGPIEIPDQPETVDPAQHVPPKLAAAVTVSFADSSLREVAKWIQEEQKIPVLFDNRALAAEGIPPGEPISDRLEGEPIYLLLNRLRSLGLAWYVENDILHITTLKVANQRMSTIPYSLSDLLDAGYKPDVLTDTIMQAIEGPWEEDTGQGGTLQWLGDVLFIRQTDAMHREVAGLLAALRSHGRQTFTLDPPQHIMLRQKSYENVAVSFQDTPLVTAVRELAEKTKADIRLDMPGLRDSRVRDREPVSLTLSDRNLKTVLHVLLADSNLTWILRDGVMWITSVERAEEFQKAAVYDVRDLCRNQDESNELREAIQSQTKGPWEEEEGEGGTISFAKTGTMVIRHTETALRDVGDLLENYRQALLVSKPRKRDTSDQEVLTRYYRMHDRIADDLITMLPALVQPESWMNDRRPDAVGSILKLASQPVLLDAQGRMVHQVEKRDGGSSADGLVVSQAVLVIRQTRAAHKEIAEVIRRINEGDPPIFMEFAGGMGGGFGGFGGGLFGQ